MPATAFTDTTAAIAVHKVRFVEYNSTGILCLSFTPVPMDSALTKRALAVSRENGSVEIWCPRGQGWFLERSFPVSKEAPVEALIWYEDTVQCKWRLFGASLNGHVLELSIESMTPIKALDSNGGAVWSMALICPDPENMALLAVGCEDGFIRLLNIHSGALEYAKTLERHDGRILSLSWDSQANRLIAGSDKSTIRLYDLSTSRCIHRMTVDTLKGEDSIVWAVQALPDGAFVSGDSLGYVTFWDALSGTPVKSVKAHLADVLCLTTNNSGTKVFSSGVDRKVIQFTLTNFEDPKAWVVSGEKRYHSHDVRAIEWIQERPFECLVTGGMDTLLIMSHPVEEFPYLKQYRLPPFPHQSRVHLAKTARVLMCQFDTEVKVWKLGQVLQHNIDLLQDHERLVNTPNKLLFHVKLDTDLNTHCSTISDDGHWIALSNMDGIKLFSVCMDEGNVRISKVKTFPTDSLPPAYQLTFTPDNGRLIIAGYDRLIYVVDLLDGAFTVLNQFDLVAAASSEATEKKKKKRDTKESNKLAGHMAVSSDGQWLALATLDKCVHLIHLDSDKIHSHIPSFDSPITSLTFHPSSACLVITLSSNLFYLYDPDAATFTDWTREYVSRLPDRFANRKEVIMGCAFDAVRPGVMTLWGAYYFCTIDLQKSMGAKNAWISSNKRKQEAKQMSIPADESVAKASPATVIDLDSEPLPISRFSDAFSMDHRFQSVMFLDFMGSEMVVVERPGLAVMQSLPEGFYKHSYGT